MKTVVYKKIDCKIPPLPIEQEENTMFLTNEGALYYFFYEKEWSCREDKISEEYPKWWLQPIYQEQPNEKVIENLIIDKLKHDSFWGKPRNKKTRIVAEMLMRECYLHGFNNAIGKINGPEFIYIAGS